jgi:ABC-2 type transport system permease protein
VGLAMFFMALNIFLTDLAMRVAVSKSGVEITLPWKDGFSYGLKAFGNNNVTTLLAIIISIFVTAEFTHGTMKNVVSKGFSKIQIYLSKLIVMIVAAFITVLLSFAVGTVSAAIVTGTFGNLSGDFVANLFKVSGIELLLLTALTAVYLFVSMSIKNLGGVIAINIVGISIFSFIFPLLEYLVKGKIKFTDYSLLNNIAFYLNGTTMKGSDYLRSAIVGLAFLAVTTILGIVLFRKSDVK